MSKIFVISLPRTGTTSFSVAMLNAGFKVAHTAFTQQSFELADVITDAPCFSDYAQLDKLFPSAKFIYLERPLENWIPSVQRLLNKMLPHLSTSGHFSPVLKRAFNETFSLADSNLLTDEHLRQCYKNHNKKVREYFKNRNDLLCIDISERNSYFRLCRFLGMTFNDGETFPHLNQGAQVAKWTSIKHTNKISSYSAGIHHRKFFDYKTGNTE